MLGHYGISLDHIAGSLARYLRKARWYLLQTIRSVFLTVTRRGIFRPNGGPPSTFLHRTSFGTRQNSRLFRPASQVQYTLRSAHLPKEFRERADLPVKFTIGAPISLATIAVFPQDRRAMKGYLRRRTNALVAQDVARSTCGFGFKNSI